MLEVKDIQIHIMQLQVVKMGADSVTIHLREDRRHINDLDAKKICKSKKVLVNLEISMNDKIVENALKIKPNYVCIVPENQKRNNNRRWFKFS